jgi:GR25 family glycosyltransferase involved in LPS biosynthesis
MNNYVDNVYLINMDKDYDRLEKVTKECDKVGIKFERFPGVNIYDLSQNILDKYIPEEIQKYGTNGILGCGLSHLFVWQDAVKNNYKNILVLEDDVYFTDDFNEYLQNVMEELPDDYDILYLGYKDLFRCKAPKNCSLNYIYKPFFPLLTHAMIISNKGLNKLLNLITKIDNHIDRLIAYNKKDLIIYASKKKIVKQIWLDSNNSNLKIKTFPKIINYYLDNVKDCNDIPISYYSNFQLYKYNDYIITRITYAIFNLGVLANIHDSILLLCLLYFACDYDRFHLIVFLLGYFIGNIFKYIMYYCKVNQYAVLCLFILLILFLNITEIPFIVIKSVF